MNPEITDPPAGHPLSGAEANGQLIVALAIVGILALLGVGLLVAGVMTGKWDVLAGGIGTIIGALGTALNAPSGIGSVLRANSAGKPAETP